MNKTEWEPIARKMYTGTNEYNVVVKSYYVCQDTSYKWVGLMNLNDSDSNLENMRHSVITRTVFEWALLIEWMFVFLGSLYILFTFNFGLKK